MSMYPTPLEKANLEAHVDLCHQRYVQLEGKINKLEAKVGVVHQDVIAGNRGMMKAIIAAAATIIAGLLSTIVVILIAFL